MDRRGGRRSSAAFFLAAFLSLVPLPRALAGEIPPPAPRFESAECPFEIPSDGSVRYGRLVVPENRQKPGSGRTVSIAVLILKSRSDHPRPDPVLYLEGGPGGPSVAYYEDWLASPILDHRDLVLFDQRGVGNSLPSLDCPEIRTARMAASSPGLDGKAASRLLVDAAGTCAARIRESGIDLSAYNTAESARDLADLRKALGLRQWNLYGISYGTRLALRLLQEDPQGVRSIVLDSVVDPAADEFGEAPANARAAFGRLFSAVSADPEARKAFPGLGETFMETAARLDRAPRAAGIRAPGGETVKIELGGADLYDAVYGFLYDPDSIPYLPLLIGAVASGDVSHLAMVAEDLLYDDLSDGLYYALQGHDEAPFSKILPGGEDGYDPLRFERTMALAFGSGVADAEANAPLSSDVPALVLAGGFDPITPPEGSRRVAKRFSRGTFLLFPGQGHAVSMAPGPEKLVAAFLEDPSKRPDGSGLGENRVRPFETRLFMTSVPYRLYTRVFYDRDQETIAGILFLAVLFLAGVVSLVFTWLGRHRPGSSRWGLAARFAGGGAAVLDGAYMALFAMAIVFVSETAPAMLFFGLPHWAVHLAWLPRLALPAAALLVSGIPALFRDQGLTRQARGFFLALAAAQILFFLLIRSLGIA
jgi:pimeloyl-ACP methyl ester carboxylesterase